MFRYISTCSFKIYTFEKTFIYSPITATSDESDNESEDNNDLESETGGSDLEESWQGVCL